MSMELKDLLLKLLSRNPIERLGAKGGAQDIKSHPFFDDIDWTAFETPNEDGGFPGVFLPARKQKKFTKKKREEAKQEMHEIVDFPVNTAYSKPKYGDIEGWEFVRDDS